MAIQKNEGFAPLSVQQPEQIADMIANYHLAAERCLGFYVLNPDSKCNVAAFDFDNKAHKPNRQWREHATLLHQLFREAGISSLVEISQSGNAAHVWVFFDEPVDAWMPRSLFTGLVDSYGYQCDEVFPKQSKLAGRGFGNLIRYPLWNHSRFVDGLGDWSELPAEQALDSVQRTSAKQLINLAGMLSLDMRAPEEPAALGELSPVVSKLLKNKDSLLGRRWNGDTDGMRDNSKSAVALSIACELVRSYVPTDDVEHSVAYWLRNNGDESRADRAEWISDTVRKAFDFVRERPKQASKHKVSTFKAACHRYVDQIEQGARRHVRSGIRSLDESIDGVGFGEMAVIAGRPGHGKSALGFQWLDTASKGGLPCLLISEEMSAEEIGKRRLASIATGNWSKKDAEKVRQRIEQWHETRAPVYIAEGCGTIDQVEQLVEEYCGTRGVRVVAIDYLQLLRGTDRSADAYATVTDISKRLKYLSRANGCALICMVQMNRAVDQRAGHVPKLSDLRESGQIEQDADLVMFLQWRHKVVENVDPGEYRIYISKRRNGPIRRQLVTLKFDAGTQRIVESVKGNE